MLFYWDQETLKQFFEPLYEATSRIHHKRWSMCPQAEKSYVWAETLRMSMVQVSIFCNEQDWFHKIKIWCSSILQTWRKRFCNHSHGRRQSDDHNDQGQYYLSSQSIYNEDLQNEGSRKIPLAFESQDQMRQNLQVD